MFDGFDFGPVLESVWKMSCNSRWFAFRHESIATDDLTVSGWAVMYLCLTDWIILYVNVARRVDWWR